MSHEPKYFLELALQKLFIAYLLGAEPVLEAGNVPGAKPALRSASMGLQRLERLLPPGAQNLRMDPRRASQVLRGG